MIGIWEALWIGFCIGLALCVLPAGYYLFEAIRARFIMPLEDFDD